MNEQAERTPEDIELYYMQDAPFHITPRELMLRANLEEQTIEQARYSAGYSAMRAGTQALRNLLRTHATLDTLDVIMLLDAIGARADRNAQLDADKILQRVQAQHEKERKENRSWYEQEQKRKAEREQQERERREVVASAFTPTIDECNQREDSAAADVLPQFSEPPPVDTPA